MRHLLTCLILCAIGIALFMLLLAAPASSSIYQGRQLKNIATLLRVQICSRSIGYGGVDRLHKELADKAADCESLWKELDQ